MIQNNQLVKEPLVSLETVKNAVLMSSFFACAAVVYVIMAQ